MKLVIKKFTKEDVKDANECASIIRDPSKIESSDHYGQMAFRLLTAMILHQAYVKDESTIDDLAELVNMQHYDGDHQLYAIMMSAYHCQSEPTPWKAADGQSTVHHPRVVNSATLMLELNEHHRQMVLLCVHTWLMAYIDSH